MGAYSRESSVSGMLKELGWEDLQERRKKARLVLFHKIIHNQIAIDSDKYLLNHRLIDLAEDLSLDQMVNFNTRKDNTLDLFFTSHPSLVEKLKSLPPLGKSDHDIVLIDTSLTPSRTKPVKRKIFQWAKANKDAIHMELHEFQDDITKNKELNTDSLWEAFKTLFDRLVMQYVPSKMSSNKHRNPWTNRTVTRLSRRKSRAHRKAKQTRHSRDWERYKHLSKSLQRECRGEKGR